MKILKEPTAPGPTFYYQHSLYSCTVNSAISLKTIRPSKGYVSFARIQSVKTQKTTILTFLFSVANNTTKIYNKLLLRHQLGVYLIWTEWPSFHHAKILSGWANNFPNQQSQRFVVRITCKISRWSYSRTGCFRIKLPYFLVTFLILSYIIIRKCTYIEVERWGR